MNEPHRNIGHIEKFNKFLRTYVSYVSMWLKNEMEMVLEADKTGSAALPRNMTKTAAAIDENNRQKRGNLFQPI
ncbi:MAG: hypothetical protein KIS76_02855 [Pyrinomonadaceae bacterium]|nr:hypothetical protein [Pyrinomonadaceae bacterium]